MLMWSLQSRNHELACVRENLKAELMTLRALAREADLCRSCGDRIARVCIDSHYVRSLGLILVPPRLRIIPVYKRLRVHQITRLPVLSVLCQMYAFVYLPIRFRD